jgi:sigma-B regulation protein RsbQ
MGQAMVFAHGFGCDQNMWRFVAPAFEKDYRVVLFDHVGRGRIGPRRLQPRALRLPARATRTTSWTSAAPSTSAADLRGPLRERDDRRARGPRRSRTVRRLVLVGPSPRYINDGEYVGGFTREDIEGLLESLDSNYLGWSSAMAPVIMANPERPELGTELTNSFCRTDPQIASHFARVTFLSDNRADLAKVKTRSLVLQCADDVIAPTAVGEYVHAQIPDSALVRMKATGHCPNLSAPEETIAAIKAFL